MHQIKSLNEIDSEDYLDLLNQLSGKIRITSPELYKGKHQMSSPIMVKKKKKKKKKKKALKSSPSKRILNVARIKGDYIEQETDQKNKPEK